MAQIADKIIIGDYLVPTNKGFWGMLNEVVEFAAGNEHYTNFKDFVKNDGCLLYTSPSPRDRTRSRMPSSA